MVRELTPGEKVDKWQKIYKKINKEILDHKLRSMDALLYYQARVQEEKRRFK